jgi:hypothetical protein
MMELSHARATAVTAPRVHALAPQAHTMLAAGRPALYPMIAGKTAMGSSAQGPGRKKVSAAVNRCEGRALDRA